MRTVVFLLLQFSGLLGGSVLLWRLARTAMKPRTFWGIACGLAVFMAVAVFLFIQPVVVFEDFVPVYWEAGRAVLAGPANLTPLLSLGVDGGFVNLPIVAYLFTPFALLPPYVAGWVFVALGVVAVLYAWWLASNLFGFDRLERAIGLLVFSGFGPLIYSFREGNSSHFMLLTLVLAIAALRGNRDFRAGLLLGVSTLIKPPLLLLCIYAAARFRWGVVLGAGAAIGLCAVASVLVFGWDANLLWYSTNIGTFSREPIAASNAHSVASVFARLYHGIGSLQSWAPVHVPTELRLASLSAAALLGLVAIWAAAPWQRWFVGTVEFEADVVLIIVLTLFVSTLTWTHYYCWLLLPAMWAWRYIRDAGRPALASAALAAAMLLSAPAYLRWAPPPGIDALLPLAFSYLLVGGVMLFILLVWARRRIGAAAHATPAAFSLEHRS